jgi:hypothetical protein
MTIIRTILPVALLLAACSADQAGAQGSPAASPAFRTIAFEVNSWGHLIRGWEVQADGTVRHVKIDGSPFADHRLEHRNFAVDAAAFARLAEIAAALPTPRPDRAECKERATDMPYGTLRLSYGKGEEAVSFDSGCLDAPYRAFLDKLLTMDDLVGGWAAGRPADSVENVSGRS